MTRRGGGRLGLWGNANLIALVAGQWGSVFGNSVFTLALYWLVLARTQSARDLSLAGSVLSLAGVAGLAAGVLVDRYDRLRLMMWADGARAALCAVAVAAAAGTASILLPLLCALLMALAGVGFVPAQRALLPAIVPDEELMAAAAVERTGTATARLVGASVGGVLVTMLGPVAMFALDGLSFVVSVATLSRIRLPARMRAGPGAPAPPGLRRAFWADLKAGLGTIMQSAWLRRVVPGSVLVNFVLAPVDFLLAAWVHQVLHLGASTYGLFVAADLGGMAVGSALAGLASRLPARSLLPAGIVAGGLCLVAFSRLPELGVDLASLFANSLCLGAVNAVQWPSVQRAVPGPLLGRVFGSLGALSVAAVPLSGLVSAWAVGVVPLRVVFLVAGAAMAASAVLLVRLPERIVDDAAGNLSA